MALGGGTFLTQNKVLPGAYINFISVATASTNMSDRGYAAMGLELDWGQEGKIFEVTNGDFQKNSMKIFGHSYGDDCMKGLRDLFKNIQTLYAYATELDNYTFNAVSVLMNKVDMLKLDDLFKKVKTDIYEEIMTLYETSCCGCKNYISKILFDPVEGKEGYFSPTPNREISNGKNVKLVEKCPVCGNKSKKFDQEDYEKIIELDKVDVSRFPQSQYIVNSRINITSSTGADRYDRIFTQRNKIALLMLQDAILKLHPSDERNVLEQVLVASISLARIAMYGSSTDILYHVVEHGAQDMNVWLLFEEKYKSFCKFKSKYSNKQIGTTNSDVIIVNKDYASYIDDNPDLKVDVIYTDFPYTDQVPYLERNQLYRIWLESFYDSKYELTEEMLSQEIVQTDAEIRTEKRV